MDCGYLSIASSPVLEPLGRSLSYRMSSILQKSVVRLLHPLVRLLLRHGTSHAEFSDWAKQVFVREAQSNFMVDGKKPSVSRVAIVTGINRKEVKRIQDLPEEQAFTRSKHNRAARVITGWLQDPEFQQDDASPKALEYGEANKDFNLLVKKYGGDVPARAVLDELLRVGTVGKNDQGLITLLRSAYIPHESKEAMLEIFGESVADILATIDHNIASPADQSRLQLSVVYDNLSAESVAKFRTLSRERGTELLKELDRFLSAEDRDINQSKEKGERLRAGLGLYFIENEIAAEDND